ncbi:hypothetical protein LF1_30520 [Rubripirellula obstinata]|uniref:Uncharacterized protein n=2 Tax=Rubripirellula obstinata TaxID=406547 RepID=A0A5B1CJQ5_9BACT|nr:hypothetical protein LF1_30520 [Rubripirellula obstinata]
MQLIVDGNSFDVAQVGNGKAVLRNPEEMQPSEAVLVITIDGQEEHRAVRLPNGISKSQPEVAYKAV